jgi:LmbE family N-acetylglucosaminyl deacetylase
MGDVSGLLDDSVPDPAPVRPLSEPPPGARVLVLAPHPDDESVGPGGLVAAHAARGDEVSVLFLTNGVHGDPDGGHDPAGYIATRRAEADAACDVLGIGGAREYWDYPDNMHITPGDLTAVVGLLADVLRRATPDLIYAPHPGEGHKDHAVAAVSAARAHAMAESSAALYGYEVWSPIEAPDVVVDVSAHYATKRDAIRCYPSQLAHTDILGAIEGLNRYRAILLPDAEPDGQRRAEVLVRMAGP